MATVELEQTPALARLEWDLMAARRREAILRKALEEVIEGGPLSVQQRERLRELLRELPSS